jgi:hypothetical protein
MFKRDCRDILGGGLLCCLGLFVAVYTSSHYAQGTLAKLGPGMFPFMVGSLLALLGAVIMLPAFFRTGEAIAVDWRPALGCLASVLLFALMIERFGMIPTIITMVLAAVLADNKLNLASALILAVSLATVGVLIFNVALGIGVPLIAWSL